MSENSNPAGHLPSFVSKMNDQRLHPSIIETFKRYYMKVITGETGLISENEIRPVAPNEIKDAGELTDYIEAGRKAFKNAVMVKLNGGLGTSMGLTSAKSLIEIKEGRSFLEIIVMQAEKQGVRLALMNSFNTQNDTLSALSKINPKQPPLCFLQNKFPKILQGDHRPASWPKNPDLEWNPPGHGDIYSAMHTSGILSDLLQRGVCYAFISNSDNLGACIDASLLGYFSSNNFSFMMEVAPRTPADRKGGHLARNTKGNLILRELAQCPEDELESFQDIHRYGFFNTNNIWVNLSQLEELLNKHGSFNLPMIRNPKTLDPRDVKSPKVYQIETAMGSAISLFQNTTAVRVPADRFFPVKKCNDLLLIRSDRFILRDNNLQLNPNRRSDEIKIDLDPKFFGKLDLFEQRFPHGIPSLVECEALTVAGDVRFEKNVSIKGRVTVSNDTGSQAIVEEGSVLDEDVTFNK